MGPIVPAPGGFAPVAFARIGCDAAGLEVVMSVFEDFRMSMEHVFSCEINPTLRKFIQERFSPRRMYSDMSLRDNTLKTTIDEEDLDFYINGIPCQHYS